MRKCRIIALIISAVLLLFSFSACNNGDSNTTTTAFAEATTTAFSETTTTPDTQKEGVSIIANKETRYKIVRATTTDTDLIKKISGFSAAIEDVTGVQIPLSEDWETPPDPQLEIIIGNTKREQTASVGKLAVDTYVITMLGNVLVINGGSIRALDAALAYFLDNLVKADGVILQKDFSYTGNVDFITESLKIYGRDISEYTVIIDSNVPRSEIAANAFVDRVDEIYGVRLEIKRNPRTVTDYEIVFGNIARGNDTLRLSEFSEFQSGYYSQGTRLYFVGNNSSVFLLVTAAFCAEYLANAQTIDIPDNLFCAMDYVDYYSELITER